MGKDQPGNPLNQARRRKFLLSELLVCGECGGGYTVMGKDRYGCATSRAKGTCNNDKTITRQKIESRAPKLGSHIDCLADLLGGLLDGVGCCFNLIAHEHHPRELIRAP